MNKLIDKGLTGLICILLGAIPTRAICAYVDKQNKEMQNQNLERQLNREEQVQTNLQPNCYKNKNNATLKESIRHSSPVHFRGEYSKEERRLDYTQEELQDITNILYAEAANQPDKARKLIVRVILNRVLSDKYPNTILEVTRQKNAFSCRNGKGSRMWNQAIGKIQRNSYENKVYGKCKENAKSVLEGEILGVERENEIVAYHDTSIDTPKDNYWNSLVEVHQEGRIKYFAPKK